MRSLLLRSGCLSLSLSLSVRSDRFRFDDDDDELLTGDGLIDREARLEYSLDFRPPIDDADVCFADDGECCSTAAGGERDRDRGDRLRDRLLER